jgi:hypothetical protein
MTGKDDELLARQLVQNCQGSEASLMKSILACLLLVLCVVLAYGAAAPLEISLMDGSRIKGTVLSSDGSEVTVASEIGVLRIALDKLTPESRQSIMQITKPDTGALLRRIAELEAKIAQLQQENESLRRQALSGPAPAVRPSGAQSLAPSGSSTTNGLQYSISSTGKRHNSRCRYFGAGRACGPTDGVPCKICGG